MVAVAGVKSMLATGTSVTVIDDVPVLPSLVAVIVTGPPAAFAVTRPVALTLATVALLDVQVTVRPVSGGPFASRGVAVSWTVPPGFSDADVGVTSTDATPMRVWHAPFPVSVKLPPATGTKSQA